MTRILPTTLTIEDVTATFVCANRGLTPARYTARTLLLHYNEVYAPAIPVGDDFLELFALRVEFRNTRRFTFGYASFFRARTPRRARGGFDFSLTGRTSDWFYRRTTFLLASEDGFVAIFQFWKGLDVSHLFAFVITDFRCWGRRGIVATPAATISRRNIQLTRTAINVVRTFLHLAEIQSQPWMLFSTCFSFGVESLAFLTLPTSCLIASRVALPSIRRRRQPLWSTFVNGTVTAVSPDELWRLTFLVTIHWLFVCANRSLASVNATATIHSRLSALTWVGTKGVLVEFRNLVQFRAVFRCTSPNNAITAHLDAITLPNRLLSFSTKVVDFFLRQFGNHELLGTDEVGGTLRVRSPVAADYLEFLEVLQVEFALLRNRVHASGSMRVEIFEVRRFFAGSRRENGAGKQRREEQNGAALKEARHEIGWVAFRL